MSLNIYSLIKLNENQQRAIVESYPNATLSCLNPQGDLSSLQNADILIAFEAQFANKEIVNNLTKVQWIHSCTAGVETILKHEELKNSDIMLTNAKGIHGIPMAEHILGTMLMHSRRLAEAWENQKAHRWAKLTAPDELYGKTVAIIGLGSIGREVAKHLKNMGMKVVAVKQTLTTEPFVNELFTLEDLPLALGSADYVVVTLPLTYSTQNLFNAQTFALMKPTAFFINVSRGAIVNEDDLITALNNKVIAGASLDVFVNEPLPGNSPLWDTDNLIITPHYSSISPKYLERALKIFTTNLQVFPETTGIINMVDKQRGY